MSLYFAFSLVTAIAIIVAEDDRLSGVEEYAVFVFFVVLWPIWMGLKLGKFVKRFEAEE